jgi:integrase/recombinase XerD
MPTSAGRSGAGGRPLELPKVLTPAERDALLAVPNLEAPTGLRNRCILELMVGSGLRVSETCALQLRDVHWGEGTIHLRSAITKGGKEATAYAGRRAEALLERWKIERRQYAARRPHLFTTLEGGPVDRRYVWSMVRRYARRAGIDHPVWPHMLRHTYATDLLRSGRFNLVEVQHLMRHDDVRTTTIYTHLVDGELLRKIRELD